MRKPILATVALILAIAIAPAAKAQPEEQGPYQVSAGELLSTYYKAHGPDEELWVNQLVVTAYRALGEYNGEEGARFLNAHTSLSGRAILFCVPAATAKPSRLLALLKEGVDPQTGLGLSPDEFFGSTLLKVLIKKYPCSAK